MPLLTTAASELAGRLDEVRERLAVAARRGGRSPEALTLVAVTKGVPAEQVLAAHALGLRHFGENRVAEAEAKVAAAAPLSPAPRWHLVGHLQRNKAARALATCDCLDSLDSLRLAETANALALAAGKVWPVLLEVNVSGEASKNGVAPAEALDLARCLVGLRGLRLEGLMTVGPLVADPDTVSAAFRRLAGLRSELARALPAASWDRLSMGMSGDFELAVAAGSTELRLGRALFGERKGAAWPSGT